MAKLGSWSMSEIMLSETGVMKRRLRTRGDEYHERLSLCLPKEYLVREGKRVFKLAERRIYKKVCVEWKCCERIKSDRFKDELTLVAAIADVTKNVLVRDMPIPSTVVACILIKQGLSRFCKCQEKPHNSISVAHTEIIQPILRKHE